MALNIGSTSIGSLYLGSTKIGQAYLGNAKVYASAEPVDPYNPLGLPPFTIRCKFKPGVTPAPYAPSGYSDSWDSQTLVDGTENIWDIVRNSTNWGTQRSIGPGGRYGILYNQPDLVSVLGANTTGVTNFKSSFQGCSSLESIALFDTSSCTNTETMFDGCESLTTVPLFDTSSCVVMAYMFSACTSLTTVPLFNTSSCQYMAYMFSACTSLTTVPLFNTSSCVEMSSMFSGCTSLTTVPLFNTSSCEFLISMFSGCTNVQSGALALYQQASTQTTPPTYHGDTFTNCGSNTVTGAAELAQIPQDWGGTYVPVDPYNPLGLPPFTIRCKFSSGYTPSGIGDSQTLVDATENIWDITKNSTNWNGRQLPPGSLLPVEIISVLGANTTGVTSMLNMFFNCTLLTSVPLFDTSSCTRTRYMFYGCSSLTSVPLFNTSSCSDMSFMLSGCVNVRSGALALYQQASTQTTPPSHYETFTNCGSNTFTGAAELAQIPTDWGGTMA